MSRVAWLMLILLCAALLFHLSVLVQLVPYRIVWGGRLQSVSNMYRFEAVSLALNAFFLLVVLAKCGVLRLKISPGVFRWVLTGMALLFLLNTAGNLFSDNNTERLLFTPLTLLLATLSFLLAREK